MKDGSKQIESQLSDIVSKASASDSFGCCSNYRKCSDAKRCVIADRVSSVNCLYRRNLEAGRIFYGKNANNFKRDVYDSFVSSYSQMPENEKEALKSLLQVFFHEKRLIPYIMLIDQPEFDALERHGFIRTVNKSLDIVNLCKKESLIEACGDHFDDAVRWAESQCTPEEWEKRRSTMILREELVVWIKKYCPDAVQKLWSGIRCVELPSDARLELEEFFLDYTFDVNYKSNLRLYTEDDRFVKITNNRRI